MQETAIVHQVYITDEMVVPDKLSPALHENVRSVRLVYPDAEHKMWSGAELRTFMGQYYGKKTLWAFDILTPYSFKSDLARFCILHHFGGLYVDLGMRMISPIYPPDNVGIVTFRAPDFATPSWLTMSAGLLWSRPGRRELSRAIEMVIDNCEARRYGADPLYPTGPVVLGRAIAAEVATKGQSTDADDQWIGASRALTPESGNPNIGYVTPDRRLVALRAKGAGGDLAHLGFEGGNNYITLWQQRRCYGEKVRSFLFTDPLLCLTQEAERTSRGIVAVRHARGVLTFGPYIEWEAGQFRLTVKFYKPVPVEGFALDVMKEPAEIVTRQEYGPFREPIDSLTMDFELSAAVRQIQFRTSALAEFHGCITEFRVEPT